MGGMRLTSQITRGIQIETSVSNCLLLQMVKDSVTVAYPKVIKGRRHPQNCRHWRSSDTNQKRWTANSLFAVAIDPVKLFLSELRSVS